MVDTRDWISWQLGGYIFNILRNLYTYFSQGLEHSPFPPRGYESSFFCTYSLTLVSVFLIAICLTISHCICPSPPFLGLFLVFFGGGYDCKLDNFLAFFWVILEFHQYFLEGSGLYKSCFHFFSLRKPLFLDHISRRTFQNPSICLSFSVKFILYLLILSLLRNILA